MQIDMSDWYNYILYNFSLERKNKLFIGFKGKNNSSAMLVNSFSGQNYLLTNSFDGLKKDIDKLPAEYDAVYLFGVDKDLTDSFRIEQIAEKDGKYLTTKLDLKSISDCFSASGIKNTISKVPTHYLCNEAYWHLLEKYEGKAVLIHIPTAKHYTIYAKTLKDMDKAIKNFKIDKVSPAIDLSDF